MESSPPSPMPFEYGEGDKDKKEKDDKKKSRALRIPLPASEVHTIAPKSFERLLPLFEKADDINSKADKDTTGLARKKEETTEKPTGAPQLAVSEHATTYDDTTLTPHEDLTEIHDTLWSEFDAADVAPAVHEPSHTERTAGAAVAVKPEHAEHAAEQASTEHTVTEHEHHIDHDERDIPAPNQAHQHWNEEHTVHLNAQPEHISKELPKAIGRPEDAIAAAPSGAGMAAEVAATEPDQESVRLWEEFNTAPQATGAPDWHPEAQPLQTNEQFNDIMQRADMGRPFVAASSEQPAFEPVSSAPRNLGSFNTAVSSSLESTPNAPRALPVAGNRQTLASTGGEGPDWHPARPRYGNPGGSLLRGAAEAGLVGGALAGGVAAHAAETGGVLAGGAAAGAVASATAGMATEQAARTHAQHELQQTQQDHAQELAQRDQQIAALTNEQRITNQHVERLTQANQQLAAEQKTTVEKVTEPVVVATDPSERLHNDNETKVVHSEWIDMAVDKRTGQLAEGPGVNQFGAEFHAEQRAEAEPADPLAIALAAAKAAARTAADVTDTYQQEHGQVIDNNYGQEPSGQIDPSHELPSGPAPIDFQHRLPAPRSPLVALVSNPWAWAGVAVLVLAFLIAAFI
jgi:hypothetical protein